MGPVRYGKRPASSVSAACGAAQVRGGGLDMGAAGRKGGDAACAVRGGRAGAAGRAAGAGTCRLRGQRGGAAAVRRRRSTASLGRILAPASALHAWASSASSLTQQPHSGRARCTQATSFHPVSSSNNYQADLHAGKAALSVSGSKCNWQQCELWSARNRHPASGMRGAGTAGSRAPRTYQWRPRCRFSHRHRWKWRWVCPTSVPSAAWASGAAHRL